MEQNHNPQNSMGLSERKTRLSVRKREVETGSPRLALALVGEFSKGLRVRSGAAPQWLRRSALVSAVLVVSPCPAATARLYEWQTEQASL